jgi:acyl-CoA dehydrogenase
VGDPMHTEERMALAEACRAFVEREVLPHAEQWERDGQIPRELHLAAGTAGILGVGYPKPWARGGGVLDSLCVSEAMIRARGRRWARWPRCSRTRSRFRT